jgi:enolase
MNYTILASSYHKAHYLFGKITDINGREDLYPNDKYDTIFSPLLAGKIFELIPDLGFTHSDDENQTEECNRFVKLLGQYLNKCILIKDDIFTTNETVLGSNK